MGTSLRPLLTLLFCLNADAHFLQSSLYEGEFNTLAAEYTSLLAEKETDRPSELPNDKKTICTRRYQGLLNDNILDIRLALGYFDWTTGAEVIVRGINYGFSPSLDPSIASIFRDYLQMPCAGQLKFCGFKVDPQNRNLFTRKVIIHDQTIQVRLWLFSSSLSESLEQNINYRKNEQIQQTQKMEQYFADSLQTADAVFYLGHSRNGGGPDFAPPVFVSGQNKVNYKGYYEVQRPGFRKLLQALKNSSTKTPLIGLMSCASREHFLAAIRTVAPDSGVISSWDVLTIDHVFTATIGGIDALLRGQCQKSFYQSLRLTEENQKYITMDNVFN